jgi:hypothetical protein
VHSPTIGPSAGLDDFKLTDQATGATASDGFSLNISGSNVDFTNYENGNMRFSTNGAVRFVINSSGHVTPNNDNSCNLGSGSLRFKEIFCTNNVINTSDQNLKKNIDNLNYGLNDLMKLRPITYNWIENDNGKRLGFIAQEVEKIIPEIIVKETDSLGIERYAMRYTELIPILVNALQQQNTQIEFLTLKVNQLLNKYRLLPDSTISNSRPSLGILYQNEPNPFDNETTIKYYVSEEVKNPIIIIVDIMTSREVVRLPLNTNGFGNIKVNKGFLLPGVYTYILQSENTYIDSKKMIIK